MQPLHFKHDEGDKLFFQTLRTRVNQYFKTGNFDKTANSTAVIKAIILVVVYVLTYFAIYAAGSLTQVYFCYGLSGMLTIFIALNIAHDAAHGTFSKHKKTNNLLLYTFDLLGASGYIWRLKHVHSHHPHVNIPNMDGDIKQSNLVRIFPNAPYLSFHRYQFLYMPILYAFYTLIWLVFRDFKDFADTDISGKPEVNHPKMEVVKLLLGKIFFFSRMVILPAYFLPFTFLQILLGFLIFNLCASYTVALALISAHVGEHSVYPAPDENGAMEQSWVRHQLVTTSDFATHNKVLTNLFGGFNHHVVHHLFPNICHIHYPQLTEILKTTCKEFGMPYHENPTLGAAVKSHLKFLKIRSVQEQSVPYLEI